jgi:hypothetical protein
MSNRRQLKVIGADELPALEFLGHREAIRRFTEAAVLLRPPMRGRKVRNQLTGRVLPCCHGPCQNDGDDGIRVEVPHPQPRWRDPLTGRQEMVVYIFCSDLCRREFVKGSPYEGRL